MKILLIFIIAPILAWAPAAAARETFRAPHGAVHEAASLAAPAGSAATATVDARGLLRIGDVREFGKAASVGAWLPAAGGYVARFSATSAGALGLRVRLDLGAVPGEMEIRVQGDNPARIETMILDPLLGPEAWTPWTEGATQVIEIYSRIAPSDTAVQVGAVLHFVDSPFAKVSAASCTLSTKCTSDDPNLDQLIDERKKSVMKIQFNSNGAGFICSATLVDTPRRPSPYVLTANHCVDTAQASGTITSFWMYESTSCGDNSPTTDFIQRPGGMQLVYTSYNVDSTLLLMNASPPDTALFAPLGPALLAAGTSVVSLSHPHGDTMRWATGTAGGELRDNDRPYDMYSVNFIRGIIEAGSSGSGIFTNTGGHLALRGILSQGAVDLSCTQPNLFTLYGRLETFYPQMAQYIGATTVLADDAPNRFSDVAATVTPVPIDTTAEFVLPSQRIDYAGDVDLYKFTIALPSAVSAWTTGDQDTVSTLLDVNGVALVAVDDQSTGNTNTGITFTVGQGTYYYLVSHWDPQGTGAYGLHLRADHVTANYTSLWWNANESGWGVNVDHQGNILFATLFTYASNGSPLWLVLPSGKLQSDGSYQGTLYSTTGPAFNAVPFSPSAVVPHEEGTMSFSFPTADTGVLTYTYRGSSVTKNITRQTFKTLPTCTWSAFDRSFSQNFQDLWWNPAESGWGVNITHQSDTLFATLFTYAANGQAAWYVMSNGALSGGASSTYSGDLFTTTGPAFNANPFTPIGAANIRKVGTMSFTFTDGNAATMAYSIDGVSVTKQIQRQVFSVPATQCE